MKQAISEKDIQLFTRTVWSFYDKQGRHDLVWRRKTDPYSIVLSEIMLQQTQVARVEEYFKKWKKKLRPQGAPRNRPIHPSRNRSILF